MDTRYLDTRYIVHDYLIDNPILIDREQSAVAFYGTNIHGQIYNLDNPECHKVDIRTINGLIHRTQGIDYNIRKSRAVDPYIYAPT